MTSIKNLSNLEGRTSLITGADGHLGRVFAETLAELGSDLVLVDLESSKLEEFSRSLESRWRVKIKLRYCDLEISQDRAALIRWLHDQKKPLHVLVNNAAFTGASDLSGWSCEFEFQSLETWRRALEVNLTSVFELCQGLAPILRNSSSSSIVNIASIYGFLGPDWRLYEGTNLNNPAAYSASKAGLIQFTRWLSTTLAPDIRVNSISPGGIFRNQPKEFVGRYEAKTPLGRMAEEDDFRGALAYLASDLSRYVTGQNLIVDGGWGTW
jgi:NAD(P)-dependent dehydrogenase (short-subunit alcohol dehydrogenase family)